MDKKETKELMKELKSIRTFTIANARLTKELILEQKKTNKILKEGTWQH